MFGRIRSTGWGEAGNIAAQGLRSSFILSLVLFPILTGLSLFLEYRFLQPVGQLDYLSAAWYLAFADAFKLTYTLYARYRLHGAHPVFYIPYSGSVDEERSDERSSAHTGGGRHWVLAACGIGTLWTLLGYANISAHNLPYSSQSVSAAAGPSALIVLFLQAASLFRRLSQTYYQALVLQFAGILIMGTALHTQFTIHMLALTVLTATISVAIESCYKLCLPVTFHDINALSFAVGIVIHLTVVISQFLMSYNFVPTGFLSTTLLILPLRGIVDIWALSLIYEYDSLVQRVLSGLGYSGFLLSLPRSTKPTIIFGFAISFWATLSFIFSELGISFEAGRTNTRTEPREKPREPRSRQLGWLSILVLLTSIAWFSLLPASLSSRNALAQDLGFTGPTRSETSLPISQCQFRKPLAFPPSSRVPYHHFDDILLIVFFSHARYDVNLDHYRAVYADYFPNVVFVGPKSREDQGFLHSYDILVDSYQSDEDLKDDKNYKMAGRMAHHMFYTALQEYPCYSGYLWAPFDTFLNIPRLEKFDQNRVWYHSPFAKYVPNIALGGDEENSDPERHPPPAIISPDPFLNLTKDWRGWGPDWWWGDPHVGLAECMPAFLKTPESQRKRLENYFDGKTRFIGGSVDTLYIPGRHRESLMATLGLFLETNCFLEIALPTALHLIIPWDEDILFVDHHWIWTPPMNPDFVRQQWHEGKEVDTFHTFHWGDKQADGIWRGDPRLIDDTRAVLQESAARQRTVLPKLVD